jgi:hypothetical protein
MLIIFISEYFYFIRNNLLVFQFLKRKRAEEFSALIHFLESMVYYM